MMWTSVRLRSTIQPKASTQAIRPRSNSFVSTIRIFNTISCTPFRLWKGLAPLPSVAVGVVAAVALQRPVAGALGRFEGPLVFPVPTRALTNVVLAVHARLKVIGEVVVLIADCLSFHCLSFLS